MADEGVRFPAEHTVMEANLEIKELKHLLKVAEDKIVIKDNTIKHIKNVKSDEFLENKILQLQAEIETLRGIVRGIDIEDLSSDECELMMAPVIGFQQHGIDDRTSEGEGLTLDNDFGIQFSDKSQLDTDDEEPNKETY